MVLACLVFFAGVTIALLGYKFYRQMDWDEPAESGPDIRAMHKRQAELDHILEVLTEAHQQGKISSASLAEFTTFRDNEIARMQTDEK